MLTRRLFIGIPLSHELRKRLRREALVWQSLPLIIIPEENLHVTLLFLGFLPEERLTEICEQTAIAAGGVSPFEMQFTHIVLTPSKEKASMVWLQGEVSEELRLLRQGLEQALGYLLPPRKSFRPHVNLARVRRHAWQAQHVQPVLDKTLNLVEPVEGITLFESLSENGKRRYQPLMEFPLA